MREGYLGDTLVWEFKDDAEQKAYRRSQWSKMALLFNYVLVPIAFFMLVSAFSLVGIGWLFGFLLFTAIGAIYKFIATRGGQITALKVRLHPGFIVINEIYGRESWWRDKKLGVFKVSAVKAVQWTAGGCYIEMDRRKSLVGNLLLPSGLFQTKEAVDAMVRWAEVHSIKVEGVPPLPGAYSRERALT